MSKYKFDNILNNIFKKVKSINKYTKIFCHQRENKKKSDE